MLTLALPSRTCVIYNTAVCLLIGSYRNVLAFPRGPVRPNLDRDVPERTNERRRLLLGGFGAVVYGLKISSDRHLSRRVLLFIFLCVTAHKNRRQPVAASTNKLTNIHATNVTSPRVPPRTSHKLASSSSSLK